MARLWQASNGPLAALRESCPGPRGQLKGQRRRGDWGPWRPPCACGRARCNFVCQELGGGGGGGIGAIRIGSDGLGSEGQGVRSWIQMCPSGRVWASVVCCWACMPRDMSGGWVVPPNSQQEGKTREGGARAPPPPMDHGRTKYELKLKYGGKQQAKTAGH
eukprot:scaffold133701_cov30-Tisochrysis_lutea.AAC.1